MSAPAAGGVLVIDDDADIREAFKLLLEASGHQLATAADGAEALALLRDGIHPRLILLDLMMPGMNGFEFRAEQLRDPVLAAIPVVIISGDGRIAEKARPLGLPWLLKPIDLDELLETMSRYGA